MHTYDSFFEDAGKGPNKAVATLLLGVALFQPLEAMALGSSRFFSRQAKAREIALELNIEARPDIIQTVEAMTQLLPEAHTQSLQKVTLNRNESDPRGLANGLEVRLNQKDINSVEEFAAVLTHEYGHVADYGLLQGSSRKPSPYVAFGLPVSEDDPSVDFYAKGWNDSSSWKPGVDKGDFASSYGAEHPAEDFAETYIAYVLHHDWLKQKMQTSDILAQKYQFMKDNVFEGRTYSATTVNGIPSTVYDTTLISYDFYKFLEGEKDRPEERNVPAVAQVKLKVKRKAT